MGLRIRYDLQLPGATSARSVRATLTALRALARDLSVERVSPIYRHSLRELLYGPAEDARDLERHFHECAAMNLYEVDVALERVESRGRRAVLGFNVHPGRGCGAAAFAFMRPGLTEAPDDFSHDLVWDAWSWSASCETQYASVLGVEHLIACHLSVIHLLDEAVRLGVTVTVRDDAEYWETRSVQHLLQEMDRANGVMARLI